jgi:hypothetical protein
MAQKHEGSQPSIETLLKRIKEMEEAQAKLGEKLDEKELKLLALEGALAQAEEGVVSLMGRHVQEQPLGKRKVKVKIYDHKASKKSGIAEYREEEQTLEFFRYLVDLPPIGGDGVRMGPHFFQHGDTVEIDLNTLRSLKEIVARAWFHEGQVKGNDENKFRQKQNLTISPKTIIRRPF